MASQDEAKRLRQIAAGNPASPSSTLAYTYDALHDPTTQTASGPGLTTPLTTSSYDLHGHLVRRQDPNNGTTFAGYDLTGLLMSQELDPGAPNTPTGAHSESFAYDAAGNRIGSIDFRGGSTQMTVDGDNRQTAQLDSFTGTTPISSTAGFDPDGNLVSQLQTIGGQSHAFSATLNPADWPQQATNDGLTSSTVGSGGGDVLAQTIQNQAGTVTYNIDQAGRDNQIGVLSMGASTPLTTTYAFNDNEQMTGVALPNNVEQDAGYDGANRLTSLSAQNTANHTLLNNLYQYGYDPLGLTNAITTTVQGSPSSQSLSHDAAGRLTAITGTAPTGSWSYDGRGNITSATSNGTTTSYTYATSNPEEVASTSISGRPTTYYAYDGNGDTTSITNTSTLNRQLSYDAQTRLTQITFGSPITQTVVITYNVFGQRANYAVTPSGAGQPSLSEHFWYQGDQLSQVAFTGTGITTPYTDTYVYSQDGTPLELLRQQGAVVTPYWYVLDGQGNVVGLTNQSGAVVDSYTYDQWGKPLTISESVPQQLRYAGYWYDNELGWYWLSVRAYDPVLERFTQPDPSEIQGLFSYVYAGDNPSDLGDPSGLSGITIPLKSGTLVTPSPGPFFENNVGVNSPQWIGELNNGTKVAGGGVGALLGEAVPEICSTASKVCQISWRDVRALLGSVSPASEGNGNEVPIGSGDIIGEALTEGQWNVELTSIPDYVSQQDLADLIKESNSTKVGGKRPWELAYKNAIRALHGPRGTVRVVVRLNENGADVAFYGRRTSPLWEQEVKALQPGFDQVQKRLSEAVRQLPGKGDVWIQLQAPSDFTYQSYNDFQNRIGRIIRSWQMQTKIPFSDYQGVRLTVVDQYGHPYFYHYQLSKVVRFNAYGYLDTSG